MTKQNLESKIKFYKEKIASSPESIQKVLIPIMQDLENQLLLMNAGEIEETIETSDMLANGNYFKLHDEHLLGTKAIGTTRFGKEYTYLKGDVTVLDAIDVNVDFGSFLKEDISSVSVKEHETADENESFVNEIIKKSNSDIGKKAVAKKRNQFDKIKDGYDPAEYPIQTYQEIFKKLNPHIDQPNLQAYVWYKEQIGQRLSHDWYRLADMDSITNIQEFKTNWIKQGALFYYKGKLLPKPIYLSGDIYSKINRLKGADNKPAEDGKVIIEKYGQATYDNQVNSLFGVYDRLFKTRLLITGNEGESSLILKPISEFAQTHQIKHISSMEKFEWFMVKSKVNYGKPNFYKTDGRNWDKQTFETLSLTDAFCLWLTTQRHRIEFKGNISYSDIIYFYIEKRSKQAPANFNESEKAEFKVQLERTKSKSRSEGNRLFLLFLKEELDRPQQIEIEQLWNNKYNNYVAPDFNLIPVAFNITEDFHGEAPFEVKPEKREAVSFLFNEGSGCLAYDVGVGKTMSAIMAVEQFIVAGYSKRPFFVVPNQTFKQWVSEIKNLLPHRKINALYNLSDDYISEVLNSDMEVSPVDEDSITVMTYEGFLKLGFSEQTENDLMATLYDILNQGGAEEMSQKQSAAFFQKLQTIVGRGLKGGMINIEDLGLDWVCYDEAHALKKVFTTVKGEQKAEGQKVVKHYSIGSGAPSDTALKGFMISQYIYSKNNNRNVVLLTATPFTNSPLEVYSMLSLVAYHNLQKLGINGLNDFFDNYIDVQSELVIDHKLKPVFKEIVKGFNNLPSLQRIILRYFNYKTGEDVGVPRPNKIVLPYEKTLVNGVIVPVPEDERVETYITMTPLQSDLMENIVLYAEGKIDESELGLESDVEDFEISEITSETIEVDINKLDNNEKAGVKALKAMNYARNLALSPYLYKYSGLTKPTYIDFVEKSPKIKYVMGCVESVKKYHEERKESVSGQVIYMDRGLEYFPLLVEYLVKKIGFEPHEIGIISSKVSGKEKQRVQDAFLGRVFSEKLNDYVGLSDEKRIKVLIGSSTIKEGMNLQKKATVLYNCFIDWNPTDNIQLAGRIWRQGNIYANVRIVNPLLIDSMDIFMFQKLEEKTARINNIWSNNGKSVIKIEELDTEEIKERLMRDPVAIASMKSQTRRTKLEDELNSIDVIEKRLNDFVGAQNAIRNLSSDIEEIYLKYLGFDFDETNILKYLEAVNKMFRSENPKDREGKYMFSVWDLNNNRDEILKKYRESQISSKTIPVKPYWLSRALEAKRTVERETENLLKPRDIDPEKIEDYKSTFSDKKLSLQQEIDYVKSDDYIDKESLAIEAKRLAEKIAPKSISQLIADFEKQNNLLSIKRLETPKTVRISEIDCQILDEQGVPKIDKESINKLTDCLNKLPQTKSLHTDEQGVYSPERQAIHLKIINDFKAKMKCIKSDHKPIAVLTGGSPGSGKSTFLKGYAPFLLSENLVKVDADEIRSLLPEYKGWNAAQTHLETKDIVNRLLSDKEIGIPCEYDLIYDGTMNNARNYQPLIGMLKKLGYEVFIVYIDNVPYKEIVQRVLKRYQTSGRFVPLEVVDDFFSKGKEALHKLKKIVDGYMVVDGSSNDYKIIESGGKKIPTTRNYEAIATEVKDESIAENEIESAILALKTYLEFDNDKEASAALKALETLKELI